MPAPTDSPMSFLQALSWIAAAVAVIVTIWKHFAENREKRLWEKAKLAKEMLNDLSANLDAVNASYML